IGSKYFEALEAGESWAIRLGMRNKHNWVIEGSAPPPAEVLGPGESEKLIQVQFVLPDKKPGDQIAPPPIIDATPQGPADYSKPALPPPREQTINTPFGPWRTSDPKGWMR